MQLDQKIVEKIKFIKEEKEKLEKISKKNSYKTSMIFSFTDDLAPNVNAINLNVVSEEKLLKIASFLTVMQEKYLEICNRFAITKYPTFTWNGHAYEDWMTDLQLKLEKLQLSFKSKKLNEMEEKLNQIVSPEMKAQIEFQLIEESLDKLK